MKQTLQQIRGDDPQHIDDLAESLELAEQLMRHFRDGRPVAANGLVQRILRLFGLLSEGEVTFSHVRRFAEGLRAVLPNASERARRAVAVSLPTGP